MKALKISSLIILTVLLNCTVEDMGETFGDMVEIYEDVADIHYDNQTYFTPPEWIKGFWYSNDYGNKVEFSDSDLIFHYYSTSSSMNKRLNEIAFGTYTRKLVEEIATDSSYFFTIRNNNDGNLYEYSFQKTSFDSILHTRPPYKHTWIYGRRD